MTMLEEGCQDVIENLPTSPDYWYTTSHHGQLTYSCIIKLAVCLSSHCCQICKDFQNKNPNTYYLLQNLKRYARRAGIWCSSPCWWSGRSRLTSRSRGWGLPLSGRLGRRSHTRSDMCSRAWLYPLPKGQCSIGPEQRLQPPPTLMQTAGNKNPATSGIYYCYHIEPFFST